MTATVLQTENENLGATAPYLDKRQLGAMLQFSVRTVDRLLAEGLPHLKFGSRRCRFDAQEVKKWLKEHYHVQRRGR